MFFSGRTAPEAEASNTVRGWRIVLAVSTKFASLLQNQPVRFLGSFVGLAIGIVVVVQVFGATDVGSFLGAVMGVGPFALVGGSIALVGLAVLPTGPRRLQLAGLAFRVIGLGLGSTWVAYGLLMLTSAPASLSTGSLIAILMTIAGAIVVRVSLRTRRPLG